MTYIDTHAHLTSEQLLPQLSSLLQRAKHAQVEAIINICTDAASLQAGLSLVSQDPAVFHTAATTPHDVETEGEAFFPLVERAAREKKLVAIGETGLDYFYEHSQRALQQHLLSRYFALAQSVGLPLIFHCRGAFSDLFAMADEQYRGLPALLHCFTGTWEEAQGVLDRGWLLSISGIVTFKKSEALRAVVRQVPLEQLVIETDAPYLAPQTHRGKINEPAFVPEVAQCIAAIKEIPLPEVARVTRANALHFFALQQFR